MRTEVLRYLLEVDKCKSISKASKNLYMSQSALNAAIKSLEEELDISIFQCSKKGVCTTKAGEKILEQAKIILDDVEKLYNISFDFPAFINYKEKMSFVLTNKFSTDVFNDCLLMFINKYPNVSISFGIKTPAECIHLVKAGTVDFAIVGDCQEIASSISDKSLNIMEMTKDPVFCLLNKENPLTYKKELQLINCFDNILITYCNEYDILAGHKRNFTSDFSDIIYVGDFSNILRLIEDNKGISILPYSLIDYNKTMLPENVTLIPLTDICQNNYIIYSNDYTISHVQRRFIDIYKHLFSRQYSKVMNVDEKFTKRGCSSPMNMETCFHLGEN